jgi:hypothetical protein
MSPADSIVVVLDKPRALRWTHRAEFKLGSLERPPTYVDLAQDNPHRQFYALCVFVWAALTDRDHPFVTADDIAPYLEKIEAQSAAFKAVVESLRAAGILAQKKTSESNGDSASGPSASSSSEPVVQATTIAPPANGSQSIASG